MTFIDYLKNRKDVILLFVGLFVLLSLVLFLDSQSINGNTESATNASFQETESENNILPSLQDDQSSERQSGDNNEINAKSAIILNVAEGKHQILFEKSKDEKLPIASLAKLMTALVVLEGYNLDQKVVIDELAIAEEGEQGVLKLGEILSVKDLLYITLIESSNRAATALAGVIGSDNFVALMNKKAKDLGLLNTNFQGATGLDPNTHSTAEDIAKLSKYLFESYPLFGKITGLQEFDLYLDNGQLHHKLENTNELLGQNGIVGGKTGWTNYARGSFMAIRKENKTEDYLIYVVLGAEDRFQEMEKLILNF